MPLDLFAPQGLCYLKHAEIHLSNMYWQKLDSDGTGVYHERQAVPSRYHSRRRFTILEELLKAWIPTTWFLLLNLLEVRDVVAGGTPSLG